MNEEKKRGWLLDIIRKQRTYKKEWKQRMEVKLAKEEEALRNSKGYLYHDIALQ